MNARVLAAGLAVALAVAGAGFGPPRARAEDATAGSALVWHQIRLDGFLSASYAYNVNRPRTNTLRVFDTDNDSFILDVFELVAQKSVARTRDTGFRVDLAAGSSVPRVSSALGLFRTESSTEDIDLQQAYLSYLAPVGDGLQVDLGKFVTPAGYEVIPGFDGWNDNATRSFLFGYAIPFTHLGLRASYRFPKASAMLMLVNGWDVARDNNRAKTVGGQVTYEPVNSLVFIVTGMTGAERADDSDGRRSLLDAVVTWKPTAAVTLGANADLGREQGAVVIGETARWDGVAAYARVASIDGLALTLRGERFEDLDGARTGTAQRLTELTLTPEARLTDQVLVRCDLRVDHSSAHVFEAHGGRLEDTQPTLLVEALYHF